MGEQIVRSLEDRWETRPVAERLRFRIKWERVRRQWSQKNLSQELAAFGCQLSEADIRTIEKEPGARPPREVRVDELMALSKCFELPVDVMLTWPGEEILEEVRDALQRLHRHRVDLERALEGVMSEYDTLHQFLKDDDERTRVREWVAGVRDQVYELVDVAVLTQEAFDSGEIDSAAIRNDPDRMFRMAAQRPKTPGWH